MTYKTRIFFISILSGFYLVVGLLFLIGVITRGNMINVDELAIAITLILIGIGTNALTIYTIVAYNKKNVGLKDICQSALTVLLICNILNSAFGAFLIIIGLAFIVMLDIIYGVVSIVLLLFNIVLLIECARIPKEEDNDKEELITE